MSYAEDLHRELVLHKETDLINISDDIDDLIEMANDAVGEYDDLEKEKDEEIEGLKEDIEDMEGLKEDIEDMEDDEEEDEITSPWGLLGEQIKDKFEEIMTNPKCNQIRFLDALTSYNNTISANKFKSAAI